MSCPAAFQPATANIHLPMAREINLRHAGGILFPADLDGDGQCEFLALQTPGLFHAQIHGGPQNPGHDHFCLTAFNQHGDILWQVGQPWKHPHPFASHGGERSLVFFDLDGDGQPEIHVIRGSTILRIEADTGQILANWPLPYDNFVALCPAIVGHDPKDRRLLASPSNQSYDGHAHGGPTLLFNAKGQILSSTDYHGFGHDPIAVDLNQDGNDEWLVGYECLDHTSQRQWRFDPVPPAQFDDMEMHVDGVSLHLDDQPDRRRIAYAASTFVYVLDLQGKLQWSHRRVHPQQVIFAHLRDDVPGPQLLVVNKRDNLELFDFDGQLLWSIPPAELWPHGKTPGVTEKFHLFDPCVKLLGVLPDGQDAILYCEGGWPYAVDGSGQCVLTLECPPSSRQPVVIGKRRPDDFGAGYIARVYENQDRQQLVVSDRRHAWVYELPVCNK